MNNNIQEDYCSFEVSKLLKEKGFDIPLGKYYNPFSGKLMNESILKIQNSHKQAINCPTHALAIKWIRENFGIHINVTKPFHKDYYIVGKIPMEFRVKGHEESGSWGIPISYNRLDGKFKSFEEATEAALLYTLQNLIP